MAAVGKVISDTIRDLWVYTDPRSVDYPLVDNPTNMIILLITYAYFVLSLGPRLMKNRKPYELKNVLIVYNIIQIVWNAYIFAGALVHMTTEFNYICEPLDHSNDDVIHNVVLKYMYSYYLLKIVDLLDTVFMVLRKNTHQVTFLHVYHHIGVVVFAFSIMKYHPGGALKFMAHINCFVHCVMYSYYLGAAVKPKIFKKNHFKKYITLLQIVQFALIIITFVIPVVQPSCKVVKWLYILLICQNVFMLPMFWDFYRKSYIQRPKEKLKQ